jgi:hypothetical protein
VFQLFPISVLCLALAGCAGVDARGVASETVSSVSKKDVRPGKYRNIAVFIEGIREPERSAAEQIVILALHNAGLNPTGALALFAERGSITEQAKADVVQREFDAVLYWTFVQKGVVEELVPNARSNGEFVTFGAGLVKVSHNLTGDYIMKPDGSVYVPELALKTKVDVQDAKTAKQVWTAETVSSGSPKVATMDTLLGEASRQIVEKMKADELI